MLKPWNPGFWSFEPGSVHRFCLFEILIFRHPVILAPRSPDFLASEHAEVPTFWNAETLKPWLLELSAWHSGILESWHPDVLESWHPGILTCCFPDIVESWSGFQDAKNESLHCHTMWIFCANLTNKVFNLTNKVSSECPGSLSAMRNLTISVASNPRLWNYRTMQFKYLVHCWRGLAFSLRRIAEVRQSRRQMSKLMHRRATSIDSSLSCLRLLS